MKIRLPPTSTPKPRAVPSDDILIRNSPTSSKAIPIRNYNSITTWPWHKSLSLRSQNARTDGVSMLNTLDIITTLSTCFICKICHTFMIDICSFPCGHMFCKYCGMSWLRLQSSCPLCNEETYRPFATRCYEMDSVIDDFYPLLFQFYGDLEKTGDGKHIVQMMANTKSDKEMDFDFMESIQDLLKQRDSPRTLQLHSIKDREEIRRRRRAISDRNDILLAAPCTSILQKLATLGWGTSTEDQSINSQCRAIIWMALCYCVYNFSFALHHSLFDGVRSFIYAALILVSLNVMQMQLFDNREEAPNFLDFELWEYMDPGVDGDMRVDGSQSNSLSPIDSGIRPTSFVSTSSGMSSNGSCNKSSSESFEECEDDVGAFENSSSELEQILQWKKEGALDFEQMFKIADELVSILDSISSIEKARHEEEN
ncbi:hypothetical protein Ocin01_13910 [Orchesella cincta]|uniref:RING-type domain-containing protein n=1 Tax=Orchesella cincta TaxID=48709 RepID=A0A1D2MIN3_ORCCI|nr:hypothetical protein Ocin01_13910 [Orchesella cincta]